MGKVSLKLILYVEANSDHKNAFRGTQNCQEIELCWHFLIPVIRQIPFTFMWDIKFTQVLWVKNCIIQIKIWEDFLHCYYQHSYTQIVQGCLWTRICHEYGFAFVVLQLRHHIDGFITISYISFPSASDLPDHQIHCSLSSVFPLTSPFCCALLAAVTSRSILVVPEQWQHLCPNTASGRAGCNQELFGFLRKRKHFQKREGWRQN